MPERSRHPLEPFASVVSVLTGAMVAMLAASMLLLALGFTHNVTLWGLGERDICVHDDSMSVSSSGDGGAFADFVRSGVAASNHGVSLCAHHASLGQETLNVLTRFPGWAFAMGVLLLLRSLVRAVRRQGPFARANSVRLRRLGWWLLAGGLLSANIEVNARVALVNTMLKPGEGPTWQPEIPLSMLITGLGMLTVARILAIATAMHQELQATI